MVIAIEGQPVLRDVAVMKKTIFLYRIVATACLSSVTACAPWPDAGQGGIAENRHMDVSYRNATGLDPTAESLAQRLSDNEQSLRQLVILGARECAPAALKDAELQKNRFSRDLDGALLQDAYNDAIILEKQIHRLQVRLNYLEQHTQCVKTASVQSLSQTGLPKNALPHETQATLVSGTTPLLEIRFDTGSSQLTEAYRLRLQRLAMHWQQIPQKHTLELRGHADDRDTEEHNGSLAHARAEAVATALIAFGMPAGALEISDAGEQEPLLREPMESARVWNRRVDIWENPAHVDSNADSMAPVVNNTPLVLKQWSTDLHEQGAQNSGAQP